jgi:hypothetical protein
MIEQGYTKIGADDKKMFAEIEITPPDYKETGYI